MAEEEIIEALRNMNKKSVEGLEKDERKLFDAIMKIADERDILLREKEELISYIKGKIEHIDNLINKSRPKPYGEELNLYENSRLRYLEILSKIEKE